MKTLPEAKLQRERSFLFLLRPFPICSLPFTAGMGLNDANVQRPAKNMRASFAVRTALGHSVPGSLKINVRRFKCKCLNINVRRFIRTSLNINVGRFKCKRRKV